MHEIKYWKENGAVFEPRIMVLDKAMVLQSDELDTARKPRPVPKAPPPSFSAAAGEVEAYMREMGIEFKRTETGYEATGMPPIVVQASKILSSDEPPEGEGLRAVWAAYRDELGRLDPDCPGCDKAKIRRKYMVRLKQALTSAANSGS